MSDHQEILEQAAAWRGAGKGVALATVVSTWGSSPRPAGAKLAVNDAGEFVGSVSGGCVEGAVIEEAQEAIRDGSRGCSISASPTNRPGKSGSPAAARSPSW